MWFDPKTAFDVIHQCLRTFGHCGWSKDLSDLRRLRDVMGLEIGGSTAGIMKLIVRASEPGGQQTQNNGGKMTYRSAFKPGLFAIQAVIVTGGGSSIGRCTTHELQLWAQILLFSQIRPYALYQGSAREKNRWR